MEHTGAPNLARQGAISTPVAGTAAENDQQVGSVPLYRTPRVVVPLLLAVLIAAGAFVYWYVGMRQFVSTDDAFVDAHRVSLGARILGRVAKLAADESDSVKAGDVLVELDDSDLRAQLEQAKANLALAQTNVVLARVSQDRADQDFVRADAQYKKAATSTELHDHARMEAAAAKARLATANAQVASAQAQLGVAETQLKNATIVAPMDGVVAKRWVLAGDVVQPGQPIFTIYDNSTVWITANLEETKVADLRVGEPVVVNADAFSGHEYNGKVWQIGAYTAAQFSLIPPNNASGNFTKITQRIPIKIALDRQADPDVARLVPGMSVEVRIKVK